MPIDANDNLINPHTSNFNGSRSSLSLLQSSTIEGITILDNTDLLAFQSNLSLVGDGTPSTPIVIDELIFNSPNNNNLYLEISNIDLHLIIKNNVFLSQDEIISNTFIKITNAKNIEISHNIFQGEHINSAIQLFDAGSISIINNQFNDGQFGIISDHCYDLFISSNIFNDVTDKPLVNTNGRRFSNSYSVEIYNNTLNNFLGVGIQLTNVANFLISENLANPIALFPNYQATGILINNGSEAIISKNEIIGDGNTAILIQLSRLVSVEDNTINFSETQGSNLGILVDLVNESLIQDNQITGVNGIKLSISNFNKIISNAVNVLDIAFESFNSVANVISGNIFISGHGTAIVENGNNQNIYGPNNTSNGGQRINSSKLFGVLFFLLFLGFGIHYQIKEKEDLVTKSKLSVIYVEKGKYSLHCPTCGKLCSISDGIGKCGNCGQKFLPRSANN